MLTHPKMFLILKIVLLLLALGVLAIWLDVSYRDRGQIDTAEQVAHQPVALVLGAGVYPDGRLSPMLADRVLTAVDLYNLDKVDKILMSGDNSVKTYNEPQHMAAYAMDRGVPEKDIAYDYAGRRTYASCWRAKHIFGLTHVIIVTQQFHLPRALYLCESLGLDAQGVAADRRDYGLASTRYTLREMPARVKAWLDIHLLHPGVIGGDPIDIFSPDYKGKYE